MSYASIVLADGAVGYWRLGEALFASPAADAAGNQNGVYTSTTGLTFSQTGIAGGSGDTAVLCTAANNGRVVIADAAAQHVADVFTTEGWVKLTSLGANVAIFAGATAHSLQFLINASNKIQAGRHGDSAIVAATAAIADTTTFHHCVWTKNAATNKVYLDGVEVSGTVTNATASSTSTGYSIAADPATNFPMNGTLDEIALYPTALTTAQVLTHYRAGANLAPVNTVAPVASGSTTVGSVVSTTNGTWTDAGGSAFTYQWQRDVLGNGVYSNILGATSSSYTLVVLDDGNDVRCQVTDTDSTGLATTANSNSILDTTPAGPGRGILLPLMGVG